MSCIHCMEGIVIVDTPMRVTRDMAMDAGDLSLEGSLISSSEENICPCCGGYFLMCINCDGDE